MDSRQVSEATRMYALGALYRAGVYARIADVLAITPKEHRRLMRFWTEELDRPAFRRREFDDELGAWVSSRRDDDVVRRV